MRTMMYWAVAAILLVLAVVQARLLARRFSAGLLCALAVTLGLVYDNSIIALGAALGEGTLLEALSWPRYILHAFLTPLLIVFALGSARRAGPDWARTGIWGALFWGLTALMIAYGVVFELLGLRLTAEWSDGLLRYVPVGGSGFPVPSMVTVAVLLAVGLSLAVSRRWWWLLLGSALATAGFGLGPALSLDILGQVAEVVLIGAIVVTERWVQGTEAAARDSRLSAV